MTDDLIAHHHISCIEDIFVTPLEYAIRIANRIGEPRVQGDSSDEDADLDVCDDEDESKLFLRNRKRHPEDMDQHVLQEKPSLTTESGLEDQRRSTRNKNNVFMAKKMAAFFHKIGGSEHPKDTVNGLDSRIDRENREGDISVASSPSKYEENETEFGASPGKLSLSSKHFKNAGSMRQKLVGALGKKLDSTLGLQTFDGQSVDSKQMHIAKENQDLDIEEFGKTLDLKITHVDSTDFRDEDSDDEDEGKKRRPSATRNDASSARETPKSVALELWRFCKKDENGFVSRADLKEAMIKVPALGDRLGLPKHWVSYFSVARGRISRKSFMQKIRSDRFSRAAAQQLFMVCDTDHSGYISFEALQRAAAEHPELMKALISDKTHDDHLSNKDQHIDAFVEWWYRSDVESSDKLSLEELLKVFQARQLAAFVWKPPKDLIEDLNETQPPADYEQDFERLNGFTGFDVAFVTPWPTSPQQASLIEALLRKLKKGGLDVFSYRSSSHNTVHCDASVVCLVRAPLSRLKEHAAEIGYRLPLSSIRLHRLSTEKIAGQPSLSIQDDFQRVRLHPFEFISAPYREGEFWDNGIFHHPGNLSHPFSSRQRIALVLDIIAYPEKYGGCAVKLSSLSEQHCLYFPLHKMHMLRQIDRQFHPSFFVRMEKFLREQDENASPEHTSSLGVELIRLVSRWSINFCWFELSQLWHVPVRMLRDYFGEKVVLYFAFLGHYVRWQIGLAVLGAIATIDAVVEETEKSKVIPWFAIALAVWSNEHHRSWKHYEFSFACRYGVPQKQDLENTQDRPDFHGKISKSVIDGSEIRFYPWERRLARYIISSFIVCLLAIFGGLTVAAILSLRIYLVRKGGKSQQYAEGLTSVLLGIYISISNQMFRGLALSLTSWENHRTDDAFEDALVFKLFVVQFLNSYGTVFYVAFFKDQFEGCLNNNCIMDMSYRLIGLLVSRIGYIAFYKLLLPRFTVILRHSRALMRARHVDYEGDEIADRQAHLNSYDPILATTISYDELIIDQGYLILFSTACPLMPILMLPLTLLRKQCDAAQLLFDFKRPVPIAHSTIGMWNSVLTVMSRLAIVTNALIIIVTMKYPHDISPQKKTNLRAAAVVGFIVVLLLFATPSPRESFAIRVQRLREAFIVDRLQEMAANSTFYDGTRSSLSYDEISKQQNKKIDRSLQISSNNDNLGLDPRPFKVTKRRRSTIGAAYHHYAV